MNSYEERLKKRLEELAAQYQGLGEGILREMVSESANSAIEKTFSKSYRKRQEYKKYFLDLVSCDADVEISTGAAEVHGIFTPKNNYIILLTAFQGREIWMRVKKNKFWKGVSRGDVLHVSGYIQPGEHPAVCCGLPIPPTAVGRTYNYMAVQSVRG